MSSQSARQFRRLGATLLVASTLFTGACGSDDETAAASTTTSPYEKVSSDAEVAAGLEEMRSSVADLVAAGPDTAAAAAADDELEPVWEDIEGTIKQNDPDTYLAIEDAMSLLSAGVEGDEAKAARGATDINAAIDAYLAKYPA